MKKLSSLVLVLCLALTMVSGLAEAVYTPGEYAATTQGMGEVTVSLTLDGNAITAVSVDVSHETPGYGADHQADFEEQILAAGSAEIDGISGCTITSNAVSKAVQEALDAAQGKTAEAVTCNTEADVIIIGAGGAGLSAAITATEAGASVIVLETNAYAGGATITSAANFINIDPEQNAQEKRNDAALEKYSSYQAEDFLPQWQPHLAALLEEIEEYKPSFIK